VLAGKRALRGEQGENPMGNPTTTVSPLRLRKEEENKQFPQGNEPKTLAGFDRKEEFATDDGGQMLTLATGRNRPCARSATASSWLRSRAGQMILAGTDGCHLWETICASSIGSGEYAHSLTTGASRRLWKPGRKACYRKSEKDHILLPAGTDQRGVRLRTAPLFIF